jgi:hypothetical protein
MFTSPDRRSSLVGVFLCLLFLVAAQSPVASAEQSRFPAAASIAPNLAALSDGELAAAVWRAVRGAERRLAKAECQRVLDDFVDSGGRPLRDALPVAASASDEWLAHIIFRDGRDAAVCRHAAAFTSVGSRLVFVCPQGFRAVHRSVAELIVIHELLHTLGLGERPPASHEIDRAVARRCA